MKTLQHVAAIVCSFILCLVLLASALQPVAAGRLSGADHDASAQAGVRYGYNDVTGKLSFVGADPGAPLEIIAARSLAAGTAAGALALVQPYARDFGLQDPATELEVMQIQNAGGIWTRFQQTYQGIPVLAGELTVNSDARNRLISISGEIAPDLSLATEPSISADSARQNALTAVAKYYSARPDEFIASPPALWIYDSRLLEDDGFPPALVWRMDVRSIDDRLPVNELVLVGAQTGGIRLHFNQVDTLQAELQQPKPTVTPTPVPEPVENQGLEPSPTPEPLPDQGFNPTATPAPVPTLPVQPDTDLDPLSVTTRFVSTTGSDAGGNRCANSTSPCKSIQLAVDVSAAGDIVKVASGTYMRDLAAYPDPNVVVIGISLTLSGGWNNSFDAQNGASIIDGRNFDNGILAKNSGANITIERFVIQHSTSPNSGGIYLLDATLTVRNSTLRDNNSGLGAGIFMIGSASLTLVNSTISGNETNSGGQGAGIYIAGGTGNIQNSTIAYNHSGSGGGGGVYIQAGTLTLTNSILSNNTSSTPANGSDCHGTINSASYDIVGTTTGCAFPTGNGNRLNTNPGLIGALSGSLPVHFLLADSPAIDTGDPTTCPATDEIGRPRPLDGDDNGTPICDIGAYEYSAPATIQVSSGDSQVAVLSGVFLQPLQVLVKDAGGLPASGTTVTFSAPGSGPSGTFAGTGTNVTSAVSDGDGLATTTVFTANALPGSYTVSATVDGLAGEVQLHLTNASPAPTTVLVQDGSLQGARFNSAFPKPLKARVIDQSGQPQAGLTVTFSAPASGASGTFSVGGRTTTALTGADGVATSSTISANGIQGSYSVDASVPGIAAPAQFLLENYIPAATSLVLQSGSPQVTRINTVFPLPFQVLAKDQYALPMPGAEVTFIAPAAGASGSFTGSSTNTETVTSNADGIATSSSLTANGQFGTYTLNASLGSTAFPDIISLENKGIIFVKNDGSDEADCITPATACATISGALSKQTGWDLIKVQAGPQASFNVWNRNLTISGGWNETFSAQTGSTIIEGQNSYPVISIAHNDVLTLDFFTFENGRSSHGAGIDNEGTLTLNHVLVTNNVAYGLDAGGGIYNSGSLVINDSIVSNNRAVNGKGGGIFNDGTLTVNRSAFIGNEASYTDSSGAPGRGGGIANRATATISNSTFGENIAYEVGGGVYNYYHGHLTLRNVTIANNQASSQAAGLFEEESPYLELLNTLVADNHAPSFADCGGSVIHSLGYNLVEAGCGGFTPTTGDHTLIDPGLDPLVSSPGIPPFYPLVAGSPAIDAGNPLSPGSGGNACEALDQRGVTRPGGAACDIGAYEGSVPADLEMRTTTFTAKNAHILPGYKMCDQSQPACTGGVDPQADSAQSYAIDAFNYFLSRYGRNGADDNALPVIATVHYQTDYDNSFWNGEQMVFGDSHGWARADDVVAHEFSHGITENTSKLFYYYQSGAINESLSDMWGEFVDQTNAKGTDNGTVRWQIGEDISGLGAIRNMQNPPAFGQPDSTKSRYYYQGWQDNGGVHVNSGVNNKAVYLLTDGGTFNKRTVSALGITKVSDIYYEVETHLLTSASDYANLYYALYQGCLNLRGGSAGITQADCQQVQNAIDAVRMNFAPEASYNPEAIACPKGQATGPALMIFNDDMEHGLGNWTTPFYSEWVYSTGFATSGERMWWGRDDFNNNESSLQMSSVIALPAKVASYLYFNHAYDFEYGGYYSPATKKYYDGGVLEYSLDGGAWKDAGPLFGSGKKYDGKLSANYQNPLGGRKAYSGISHGYVSSRYNLSSLAGHTVSFRWRIGTDEMNSVLGWFLDDVQIYTCQGAPSKPSLTAPANKALVASYTPMLDWKDLTVNFHHYQVQVATSSAFSTLVIDQNNLPVSNFTPTTPLAPNTIFYWRVRAFNAVGVAGAWSKVYSFHTPMPASIQLNTDNGPGLR